MINKIWYLKKDLRNVTEFYYNIIFNGLRKNNVAISSIADVQLFKKCKVSKCDYFLLTSLYSFFILYIKGYRNFIYWFQGMAPEEAFLLIPSKPRYWFYCFVEKLVLRHTRYKIGVSEYLFQHFENKHRIKIDKSTVFIMPCFNSTFNPDAFRVKGKYEKQIFCYAGGMQPWQGVGNILSLFSELEKNCNNVFLKILSKDLEAAEVLIRKYDIKNYSLSSVPQEQVAKELEECKFGFILRDDTEINNVATPTKLAAYVGNGIIPIFTSTIYSYRDLAAKYKYLCCIDNIQDIYPIVELMNISIDYTDLLNEYKRLFEDYFSVDNYSEKLKSFFSSGVQH